MAKSSPNPSHPRNLDEIISLEIEQDKAQSAAEGERCRQDQIARERLARVLEPIRRLHRHNGGGPEATAQVVDRLAEIHAAFRDEGWLTLLDKLPGWLAGFDNFPAVTTARLIALDAMKLAGAGKQNKAIRRLDRVQPARVLAFGVQSELFHRLPRDLVKLLPIHNRACYPNAQFPLVGERGQSGIPADCWIPPEVAKDWQSPLFPLASTQKAMRQWREAMKELNNGWWILLGHNRLPPDEIPAEASHDLCLIHRLRVVDLAEFRLEIFRGMEAGAVAADQVEPPPQDPEDTPPAPQQNGQAGVALPKSEAGPTGRQQKRDRATEARDKWLYQCRCKKIPDKKIIGKLKACAEKKAWTKISSPQGIQQAAQRYAKRNGLPFPPPRKEN